MPFNSLFLQAADGAGAFGGGFGMLLPLILIIAIMYFFMIRPQNKKQKEMQKMLDALKKGDKVITIGGIHGTISSVKPDSVVLKVDDNVKIEFNRTAISTVLTEKKEVVKTEEKKSLFGKKDKGEKTVEPTVSSEASAEVAGEEKSDE